MESIDNLIAVSKHLYDHRVAEQKQEIEKLNNENKKFSEGELSFNIYGEENLHISLEFKWNNDNIHITLERFPISCVRGMRDSLLKDSTWYSNHPRFYIGWKYDDEIAIVSGSNMIEICKYSDKQNLIKSVLEKLRTHIKD